MLKHLTIKNYALIQHLELSLSEGLSVITGETGAGKSILLGAIGLLTGNRADTKVLWDTSEKCMTEGVFDVKEYDLRPLFESNDLDYAEQTVIRREISPAGKSRAFINDTPVTLETLKTIGTRLMDIHSQHETLLLGNEEFQVGLVDSFAGNDDLIKEYTGTWNAYLTARQRHLELNAQAETLRAEADFVKFQLDELTTLNLETGEQEKLESELKMMEHAEDIKVKLHAALQTLQHSEYSTRSSLAEVRTLIASLRNFGATFDTISNRLESTLIELDDIIQELEHAEGSVLVDPERNQYVQERLSTIYRLQKKHRVNTVEALLSIRDALQAKAKLTTNLDEALANAETAHQESLQALRQSAQKLSSARRKVSPKLTQALEALLKEVGIPEAKVTIQQDSTDPQPSGADAISLLFSANKGIPPKPLAQVASGGEFSRLMFCIKYILAEKKSLPTLLLDEIDNGVSGEIAIRMGQLMRRMSMKHQLISITHLPQIAAQGNDHFFVYKDNSKAKTISNIRKLSNEDRIQEIAQMLSGASPTRSALASAKELLAGTQ